MPSAPSVMWNCGAAESREPSGLGGACLNHPITPDDSEEIPIFVAYRKKGDARVHGLW
jgi:hypothetical protein